jgi:hypothetical protein
VSAARRPFLWIVAACAVIAGCAPRAGTLAGVPAPERALPRVELPAGRQRVVFRWRYEEAEGFTARGEGVARIAPPDSGRLDFFLDGGFGSGYAMLVGDQLTTPGDLGRRLIPPGPMLWAALGRVALPAARDTSVTVAGDTLRAELRGSPTWRVMLVGSRLTRLDRIVDGRVVEWVTRDTSALRYRHETERRSLSLDVTRTEAADAFPASIWRR